METQDISPTISVSASKIMQERLDYIQEATGLKSRSAAVTMAVNVLYDKLVNQAHIQLERKQKRENNN
jgi:metal-responsive CopG/Arc/MetJ family transcriptional regulator